MQASDIRAFSDDEYRVEGVSVVEDVENCDSLFGIREAKIKSLIPNKHCFFFGHIYITKIQEYNRRYPDVDRLVKRKDVESFSWNDFTPNAKDYESRFLRCAKKIGVSVRSFFLPRGTSLFERRRFMQQGHTHSLDWRRDLRHQRQYQINGLSCYA